MMELRVLEYFLAVAREQNITRAAEYLHLTQPTLSRQLSNLEKELGKTLFIRGKRKVTLTDDGVLLRKRAEEILGLVEHTLDEMRHSDERLSGNIYIGSGESNSIRNILHIAKQMQVEYPEVHFHIVSGDSADLSEKLDKGLFDFCILYGDIDRSKYEYIQLPFVERWGVLMKEDCPYAKKEQIELPDLAELPLIVSRQLTGNTQFFRKIGIRYENMNIVGTYNLINNAVLMAEENMGYVLTLENLVNTNGTDLCFKQIIPEQTLELSLVWKKYQPLTKAAEAFVNRIDESITK